MKNARPYERTCLRCDAGFTAAKPSARYCSANCRKRAGDDRGRAVCTRCGSSCGARTAWSNAAEAYGRRSGLCGSCRAVVEAERVAERARQIEAWWSDGLTLREIAERLGWSIGHLKVELFRLREDGYDLPYRYAMQDGQRIAA